MLDPDETKAVIFKFGDGWYWSCHWCTEKWRRDMRTGWAYTFEQVRRSMVDHLDMHGELR